MKDGRKPRLYSLFEKREGKWVRISDSAFHKQTAIRVYQSMLLDGAFNGITRELRVIPQTRTTRSTQI